MAFAIVQKVLSIDPVVKVVDWPITVTQVGNGNSIVGCVAYRTGLAPITSIDDDKGNTYTLLKDAAPTAGGLNRLGVFGLANITNPPATTITVHFGGAIDWARIAIVEVSGSAIIGGSAIRGQIAPGTATDAVTSGAMIPTVNGSFIYGCSVRMSASSVLVAGTSFTLQSSSGGGDTTYMQDETLLAYNSAAPVAGTFTCNGTSDWVTGAAMLIPTVPVWLFTV